MAIDQEIAQRVDAYRGNPQVLQQRYAANQELLDLLALQRLKSEKDDAMRKVQLEMQQDPQTIKQQKERQLLEMTKQDLTNQTAGIMQNTQKKQKKNMQRVAKRGSASPQQVQKMQAGLGALAQHQQQQAPQQAPMRMAAGGIVAFQEAGLVRSYNDITQAEINAYRERLRRTNAPSYLQSLSDDYIRKILSDPSTNTSEIKTVKLEEKPINARGEGPQKDPKVSAGLSRTGGKMGWEPIVGGNKGPNGLVVPDEEGPTIDVPGVGGEQDNSGAGSEGLVAMLQAKELAAPDIDMTGIKANQAGKNILQGAGIGAQNPNVARIKARDDAATFLGRDKKRGKMNEYLEELKALDISQQDPRKMRSEQISAFLRNAGGGSFGQTMAAGSQGMADERSAQEKASRDQLLSRLDIEKSAMDMDMNIAKSAQSSGDNALTQSMQHQRMIATILAQTRRQEFDLAVKNAELKYNADKDNVQSILKALELKYKDSIEKLKYRGDRADRAERILGDLNKNRAEFLWAALSNNRDVIAARIAVNQKDPPKDAEEVLEKAKYAVMLEVAQMFELAGLNEIEDIFIQIANGEPVSFPNNLSFEERLQGLNPDNFSADAFGPMTVK